MKNNNDNKGIFSKMKEKLRSFWDRIAVIIAEIRRKGNEYLTIMLVPHSEKSIFNLQVSYFTIFYISILIIVIVVIGSFAIVSQSKVSQEMVNLRERGRQWDMRDKLLKEEIKALCRVVDEIKPEIQKLYDISGNKDGKMYDLWARGGATEDIHSSFTNEYNEKMKIPSDVIDVKNAVEEITLSKDYISKMRVFLRERENVLQKIPTIWPCAAGGYKTSDYGWRKHPLYRSKRDWHRGIDIGCWPGAPIIATANGNVTFAGWKSGYGLTVIIEHEFGYSTFYAHCSALKAKTGQRVKKGQTIAYLGRTGRTTGYHLHYEVRIGNKDVDPWPYIMNVR